MDSSRFGKSAVNAAPVSFRGIAGVLAVQRLFDGDDLLARVPAVSKGL